MRMTNRDRERLIKQDRDRRAARMRRDHEIELLLDAGIELAEAIRIVDQPVAA